MIKFISVCKRRWRIGVALLAVTLVAYAATRAEDFSGGAEAPITGTWTTVAGSGCNQSASGVGEGSGGICGSAWSTGNFTFAADQSASIKILTPGTADDAGPCVRMNSAGGGNGYCAIYRQGDGRLYMVEMSAGAFTTITAPVVTLVSGDTVKIAMAGTTITTYINGALQDTQSDATIASGQPGFAYQLDDSNVTKLDDWLGEDGTSASSGLLRRRRE